MKKVSFSFALASLFVSQASSIELQSGLSGNSGLEVGVRDAKSNISPLANSDYLSGYNADNSDTAAIPSIGLGLYHGNLIDNDRVFLKNYDKRDLSGIALDYERVYLERFSTSLSFISSLREKAYANPYFIGNREETDASKYGFRISQLYEGDFGKSDASYVFAENKLDKESIEFVSLKREGSYHELELNHNYSLLNLGLNYGYNDANRKAQSYSRHGFKMGTHLVFARNYILTPSLGLNQYKVDGTDPIFNRKQDGSITKSNLKLVKNQFLGYNSLHGFTNYGLEKRNSDIDFHSETYHILLTGVGYKF